MATQEIGDEQTITIKTFTGKILEINYPTCCKMKHIYQIKKWITDNHGIAKGYQELFDQASGKKMDNKEKIQNHCTALNLVIKPMPKFELLIYSYDISTKINAVGGWSVQYLYKRVAEILNYPNTCYIQIIVTRRNGCIQQLDNRSKTALTEESIDTTCTLKVHRLLDVTVTDVRYFRKVRIDNKDETMKYLIKKFREEFKMRSKPKARYKGLTILSGTRLLDLSFQMINIT